MLKRMFSVALALCVVLALSVSALAASFSDLITPFHDWAEKQIEEMTVLGIIKGYSDGTFRPDQEIKRIEALVLIARAAGYSDESYSDFTEFASELYSSALDNYSINYKDEVAFLLYKGILSEEELPTYIGANKMNGALLRYEAAVLFTKLMGAEDEVKASAATVLDYDDQASIPVSARAYVEYVTTQKIMNGVYDIKKPNESNFSPNTGVTRAQAAVLLYRVLEKTDLSVQTGIVTQIAENTISYREESGVIEKKTVDGDIALRYNGAQGEVSDIKTGAYIAFIFRGDKLYEIEAFTNEADEIIEGQVTNITDNKISVKVSSSDNTRTVYFADTVAVTIDGEAAKLGKIAKDDYVKLSVKKNKVTAIEAQAPTKTYSGTLSEIDISGDEVEITVSVTGGEEMTFTVPDSATVTKNGSKSSLSEILVGDKVVVSVSYGAVSAIKATNTKSSVTGIISEINIATQSSIKVKVADEVKTYPIAMNATIYITDVASDIYALRLSQSVTLNLEGGTITSIYAKASSVSGQYSGVVKSVNTSYGYVTITITESDGSTTDRQIFVEKNGSSVTAKIYNSATGKDVALKTISEGDNVTVVGATTNGAFVATTILILP